MSYCLLFCWKRSFGRTNEDAASVPPTSPSSINTPERVAPLMSDNELLHRRKRGTILLKGTFASASRKEDRLLQSPPPQLLPLSASLYRYGGLKTLQLQEYRTIWPLDTVSKPNEARTRRIYSLWSSGRERKKIITRGKQTSLIFPVNIRPSAETINLKVALKADSSWSFANNNHLWLYLIIFFCTHVQVLIR